MGRWLVVWVVVVATSAGCSRLGRSGESETPPLHQAPYMVSGEQADVPFVAYYEGLRRRTEHGEGDVRYIAVIDLERGERLSWWAGAPEATLKRTPMRKAAPGTLFYWNGLRRAERAGACSAAGEIGTNWRKKVGAAAIEEVACISSDGVILRVSSGEMIILEVTKVVRGDVPDQLFAAPAGERAGRAED